MSTIPKNHNPDKCHKANVEHGKVIDKMKNLLTTLEETDNVVRRDSCPYGAYVGDRFVRPNPKYQPLITYPVKPERPVFKIRLDTEPIWSIHRYPSRQIISGEIISHCDCKKRNGLQDNCQRTDCRGSKACLSNPPVCPPAAWNRYVTQEEANKIVEMYAPKKTSKSVNELCESGKSCKPSCILCCGDFKQFTDELAGCTNKIKMLYEQAKI